MVEPILEQNTVFNIEKVYVKDVSYEAPSVPLAFIQTENTAAEIGVQLGLEHAVLNVEQGHIRGGADRDRDRQAREQEYISRGSEAGGCFPHRRR